MATKRDMRCVEDEDFYVSDLLFSKLCLFRFIHSKIFAHKCFSYKYNVNDISKITGTSNIHTFNQKRIWLDSDERNTVADLFLATTCYIILNWKSKGYNLLWLFHLTNDSRKDSILKHTCKRRWTLLKWGNPRDIFKTIFLLSLHS